MKKLFTFLSIIIALHAVAQAPSGYYYTAEGKTTSELKTTLSTIISQNYKDVGYGGLNNVYRTSDNTVDGKVWDMYSTCIWEHNEPYAVQAVFVEPLTESTQFLKVGFSNAHQCEMMHFTFIQQIVK